MPAVFALVFNWAHSSPTSSVYVNALATGCAGAVVGVVGSAASGGIFGLPV